MILQVNPNRMELLRLRRRLVIAQRGHKLLQDKLEELMRRFLGLLKDIDTAKEDFNRRTQVMIKDLVYCRITSPEEEFEESLSGISLRIRIAASTVKVMNVKVPELKMEEFSIERNYNFFKTSAQLDIVTYRADGYLNSLLVLAKLLKALDILSYEIERTRRRVNALEYVLIPSIQDTIRYISQKLSEFERSNLTRLMRVKEMIEAR